MRRRGATGGRDGALGGGAGRVPGCLGGALIDLDDPGRWRCALFPRIADLLDGEEAPGTVGIDVPIGLPDRVSAGRCSPPPVCPRP